MKYPITPEYLDGIPKKLEELYQDLEADIIRDICRRIKLSGTMTESALHQIRMLQQQGLPMEYIERRIRQTADMSRKELEAIFNDAVERNEKYLKQALSKADVTKPERDWKGALSTQIEAIRRQTEEEFVNLTQSMGFAIRTNGKVKFYKIADAYQKTLDIAAISLATGTVDYNTAIRDAVDRLTDSGIQWVHYESGWRNRADVAARRAIMTGVSQIAARYSEQTMELLDTDLVEVTAHAGARDKGKGYENHKKWQGFVYSMSGKSRKYPSLKEVTGYGEGGGLCGWNCRHHFYAYIDGVSERAYTDEQLKNIDKPPFEYQGRTYTAYEATQKQRQIETAIRAYKRKLIGYETDGLEDEYNTAAGKLRRLRQEYRAFSEAAGLRMQPERYRVKGFGQREAAKARNAKV